MWKLTIEDDQGNRIPVPLVRDDYSIGRAAENTLRLTERNVSRRHASLQQTNGRWELVDLGSYNGSYVNGERVVERQELADGDLIQLADYRIEVVEDGAEALPQEHEELAEESAPQEALLASSTTEGFEAEHAPAQPVQEMEAVPAAFVSASDGFDDLDDLDAIPGVPAKGNRTWTGIAVGGIAALGILGVAFAMLGGEKSKPEMASAEPVVAREVEKAAVVAPPSEPVKEQEEPPPAAEVVKAAALALDDVKEEPVKMQAIEVAEAKAPPAPPAPAPVEKRAEPPAKAAVAAADTKPQQAPRPPAAAKPPPAGGERRPVLAANPFDTPSSSGREAAKPPTSEKASGSSKSLSELAAQGREGEAKMRPILEQRIASGRADTRDIKLLRAICSNMGDRVCVDRMNALLAKRD